MGLGTLDPDWAVNGTPIYAPTANKVDFDHDNIVSDDSGRVESGFMHIRWVRPDVLKINLVWDKLTGNEKDHIKNLMQGKEFEFTYWDNGRKVMNGYCGKVSYTLDRTDLHEDEGGVYRNIRANVVEI